MFKNFTAHIRNNRGDENAQKLIWIAVAFIVGAILLVMLTSSFKAPIHRWFGTVTNDWFAEQNGAFVDINKQPSSDNAEPDNVGGTPNTGNNGSQLNPGGSNGSQGTQGGSGNAGTENPSSPPAPTRGTLAEWSLQGYPTGLDGANIWSDGTNVYFTLSGNHYVWDRDNEKWIKKPEWSGPYLHGENIWTDGVNMYHTLGGSNYILKDNKWVAHTFDGGPTYIQKSYIWSDGQNTYFSDGISHYVLQGNKWIEQTWVGTTNFHGQDVWQHNGNIYISTLNENDPAHPIEHYILSGNMWVPITWKGECSVTGQNIWTDGTSIYYSNGTYQYQLQGDTWVQHTWENMPPNGFGAASIWTDGEDYYYFKRPYSWKFE